MLITERIHPSVTLTPQTAERVADEMRDMYGMGQAYHLRVSKNDHGKWEVDDGLGHHFRVAPMNLPAFRHWFTAEYADVIAEHLEPSDG